MPIEGAISDSRWIFQNIELSKATRCFAQVMRAVKKMSNALTNAQKANNYKENEGMSYPYREEDKTKRTSENIVAV
mgnify:CR=1 FL=1